MEPEISYTDLVIIGAGPAGLMAAAWASRLKLNTRVLDDKAGRVKTGRADGLHVRTLEILDSFGLERKSSEKAYQCREISAWVGIFRALGSANTDRLPESCLGGREQN